MIFFAPASCSGVYDLGELSAAEDGVPEPALALELFADLALLLGLVPAPALLDSPFFLLNAFANNSLIPIQIDSNEKEAPKYN